MRMPGKKVMTTKYCLLYQHGLCKKVTDKSVWQEPFYLENERGEKLLLDLDCTYCEMNIFLP